MTQQDKELLLVDLCARLPYGVIIQEYNEEYGYSDNALNTIGIGYFSIHEACIEGTWINHIENIRPYLRPVSSMTKEERKEFKHIAPGISVIDGILIPNIPQVDWLNAHHFDFRNLIDKGLAIDCTNLNIY